MKKIYFILLLLTALASKASAQCIQNLACPGAPVNYCDLTTNDPNFWNENYWLDTATNLHDLNEGSAEPGISFQYNCQTDSLHVDFLLFLDTDVDGSWETVVSSQNPPDPGTINYGNIGNPNYTGGTARFFDERPVLTAQKYSFVVEQLINGTSVTANLKWHSIQAPNNYYPMQLPPGTHKIEWTIRNDAGEMQTCSNTFIVKDCKAPTVVCLNGLSVNLLQTGTIQLFASDFLQYMSDNYTPVNQLQLAIRKSGTGTGFPKDTSGNPIQTISYGCPDLGTQVVELWSKDAAGNADYCETYVLVQNNLQYSCNDTNQVHIRTCLEYWCDHSVIATKDLKLYWAGSGLPGQIFSLEYGHEPCLEANLHDGSNSTITPVFDGIDQLNGIDVQDLIDISKHILGIKNLPSPYALIAADINRSGSVTTFDEVELIKLMVGIYNEFPNNTTWRFVDAGFVFSNPDNPFATALPESKTLTNVQGDTITTKFYGIKIGDVNCSAIPGLKGQDAEDRSTPTLLTTSDHFMAAGETWDMVVHFDQPGNLYGFQLGIQTDPQILEIVSGAPGNLPGIKQPAFGQPAEGLTNMIWYQTEPNHINTDQDVIHLRIRALKPTWLHDAIRLSDGSTVSGIKSMPSRVYDGESNRAPLQLNFTSDKNTSSVVFEPYPNPTSEGVIIPVQMAGTEDVEVELYDVNGSLAEKVQLHLPEGMQQIQLSGNKLVHPGLYICRIRTNDHMTERKIIRY
jgi:hypothetical protein